MGIGFTIALVAIASIREVLGAGTVLSGLEDFGIQAVKIPVIYDFRIPILAEAPGGFLVYGIVIAVMNKLTEKKGGVKRKSFSCEGCPSASICGRVSCSENAELVCAAEENTLVEKEDK